MTAFELFGVLKLDKSDFDKGLKDAESAGSGLGKGLQSAAKIGLTAIAGATTAVVGFGATAVQVGSTFDQAMGGVAATLGQTVDELDASVGEVDTQFGHFSGTLREFAMYMGQNTVFSATQAAEALNYMALAGYDTQESMEMLPSVLDMAAAGGMELAKASDMITDTQRALGLDFERTSQMVDEFAKAASTGNTNVEQLGEAFLRVGGLASELNGGFVNLGDGTLAATDGTQELEIAFTAMANAGIKGSEAGTHMRNMLLKLSSPTKDGAAALEAMGVSVFDAEGNMRALSDVFSDLSTTMGQMTQEQRMQTISDLFNTRDMASAEALLSAINQDWDAIGASILDADGAAAQMAATKLDNLSGDITLFKSALESAQITLNDQLSPTLRQFVQFGTEGIQSLTTAFQEGGVEGAMSEFGNILAQGITMITKMLPDVVSAGAQLLGALVQGLFDAAPQLMDSAGQLLEMLWNGIVTGLPLLTEKAVEIIGTLAQGIRDNLPQMIETGMNALMEFSGSLRENVGTIIEAGLDLILALAEGLINGLPTFIQTIPTIVSNIAGIINDNMPKILATGVQIIVMLAQGIVQSIPVLIQEFPKIIKAIIDVWTAVNWLNLGKSILEGIGKGVKLLAENVPKALKEIGEQGFNFIKSIDWKNLGTSLLEHILAGILILKTKVPQLLKSIGTQAFNLFKSIDWISLGKNIVLGIINGIGALAGKLLEAAKNLGKNALKAAANALGIKSPSREFMWIGQMVDEGFAAGIENNLDMVQGAMDNLGSVTPDSNNWETGTGVASGSPVVVNVYGAPGQDEARLADIIEERINEKMRRREVVYA